MVRWIFAAYLVGFACASVLWLVIDGVLFRRKCRGCGQRMKYYGPLCMDCWWQGYRDD